MTKPTQEIHVYTDGACSNNPGPGGWGVYVDVFGLKLSGHDPETTNNRMELMGAIKALEVLQDHKGDAIQVFTDSQYVKNGITQWIEGWKAKGWKASNKKSVANKDLWVALDTLSHDFSNLSWQWVKGHAGVHGNEIADQLASDASHGQVVDGQETAMADGSPVLSASPAISEASGTLTNAELTKLVHELQARIEVLEKGAAA